MEQAQFNYNPTNNPFKAYAHNSLTLERILCWPNWPILTQWERDVLTKEKELEQLEEYSHPQPIERMKLAMAATPGRLHLRLVACHEIYEEGVKVEWEKLT